MTEYLAVKKLSAEDETYKEYLQAIKPNVADIKNALNKGVMDDMTNEKMAECMAISEAFAYGHCKTCEFLKRCEQDRSFEFPPDAWCQNRKRQILGRWGENDEV